MDKFLKPHRIVAMGLVLAVLLAIYGLTFYRIQTLDTQEVLEAPESYVATVSTVHAARGSLLDRNGVLLSSDVTKYDVCVNRDQLLKQPDPNGILGRLIDAALKYGVAYSDPFPVTMSAPFEYLADMTGTQRSNLTSYFKYFSNTLSIQDPEDPGISAADLVAWLRSDHYKIDYTLTAQEARRIIGVRYGLELQPIVGSTYTFATDVSPEFITYLAEQNLAAVSIEARSVRQYSSKYATHVLGYVGAMTRAQYDEKYKALGYPFNCTVGQVGAESAFEEYLHGTDGSVTTYTDSTGAVVKKEVTKEAKAGDNVYLTIDMNLQMAAEDALASTIAQINRDRVEQAQQEAEESDTVYVEPELALGGAVVAMDPRTGEVLALASYPTYDLSTFFSDYTALSNDPGRPLVNRATTGLYNPGSTFKMVTAYAALSNLYIAPGTVIHDEGIFREYEEQGFTPTCTAYPGSHGDLNVVSAIEKSCNFFFYSIADRMGITRIAEAARLFGLGAHTGIEIGDTEGTVASREAKQALQHEGWWAADTLLACIGQSINFCTPVQLANYVSTIANGGTLRSVTVLKSVTSFDYSDVLLRRSPKTVSTIDDPGGYIPVLQRAMRGVATSGTARSALSNYPIPVAAKTGTVQSDTSSINDGVFVCYAPADDPQIAIAVVVQKGGSGSALITIAKDVMDVFFADSVSRPTTVDTENTLLK